MRQTPLSRLIEQLLGADLREHVVASRNAGLSWGSIAGELSSRTGLDVQKETLRAWFAPQLKTVVTLRSDQPRGDTSQRSGAA